ncbi:MAG TPA: lysyl oxidase family protein [Kofleriaceae bacterium]
MRVFLFSLVALAGACGDDRLGPVDTPADQPPGLPDLALVGAEMDGTVIITQDTFLAGACEVVEGCVGATGTRRLLRFDTVTANIGTADLEVGVPPADGVDGGVFVWSGCHMHHHVTGYATYELRDATGTVLGGHKQAFCLQDLQQVRAGAPSQGFSCARQGLSAGWGDVYNRSLPCQWIDVTTVPAGSYTLRVVINPERSLADEDPGNNEWTLEVSI